MALPFLVCRVRTVLPLALWLAVGAAPVAAQTQAPNQAPIVIPPAPTIVASPPGAAMTPDAVAPSAAPPGLTQTPAPLTPTTPGPATLAPGAQANADSGAGPAPVLGPVPAVSWDPAGTARLGVLNVVDGSVSEVRIQVGGQASIGDLKISVLACLRRPPDQVPDAAAFIDVQADAGAPPPVAAANAPLDAPPEDTADQGDAGSDEGAQSAVAQSGPPAYRGWMVRSMPAAMVVGDASETFRVIDCS